MTTRRKTRHAEAAMSLEFAELKAQSDELAAQAEARNAAFREEWQRKLASDPPPPPLHVGTLHVHDAGCFEDVEPSTLQFQTTTATGRVCRRVGIFVPAEIVERAMSPKHAQW